MRHAEGLSPWAAGRPILLAVMFSLVPATAFAQAWTPPAGSGSVSIITQSMHVDAHTLGDGRLVHNIDLRAHSLNVSVDYGVTDRLAVTASVPYVTSRYRGPVPHVGSIVDDGNYHGAISDLDLELRYKAIDGRFVLTPYVGGLWPTRNYGTLGHATAGRGLTEYSVGVDAGHEAVWLRPSLFVGGGLTYTFVEKVHDDISVDRSDADLRVSYYVTSRWSVHTGSSWQRTHGGLDLPLSRDDAQDHSRHHDQMLRVDYWRVNAGVAYSVRPNLDLFAGWSTSVRSENAHAARSISLGIGWSFERPSPWRRQTEPPQIAAFRH